MKEIIRREWTEKEMDAYHRAVKEYPNQNIKIQEIVETKTVRQIRHLSLKLKQLGNKGITKKVEKPSGIQTLKEKR